MMNIFSKNDLVEIAVQLETSGYEFYNQALQRKDLSENVRKSITYLRNEELKHKDTFENLRSKSDLFDLQESSDWEEAIQYMKVVIDSHIFAGDDASIRLAVASQNEKQVLEYALSFEKDTLLMFHSFKKFVRNKNGKKAIQDIIDEEYEHVIKISALLENLQS